MRHFALVVALVVSGLTAHAETHSQLWGRGGELWEPTSRLPDFSFAGYHCGEDPLPKIESVTDVTRFGARGDGKTDCTAAFRRAIEETDRGAIAIPAGRFLISDIIWINKPNIVLRGAGPEQTVIVPTTELEDIRPNMGSTTTGRPTSNYSWSGGFLWARGNYRQSTITQVVSEAQRGTRRLIVADASKLKVGQRIAVQLRDDDYDTLLSDLYSGDPSGTAKVKRPIRPSMVSRIAAIEGASITLERPLRWDVRTRHTPTLATFEPTVTEVGIEDLSIEFPAKSYEGHFTERGLNGIAMNGVADCWVRNVRISNCDSAVYLSGTFCTIDGLVIDSDRPDWRGTTGHHGITFGHDCLATDFEFRTHFIHDFTLAYLSAGNVAKNGRGENLSLDHHKCAPHDNLFCNLDVGEGSEIWRCGGGAELGKHCGARGTFWCIRAEQDLNWPPPRFGPDSMNLVGLRTSDPSTIDPTGRWFEAIPPDKLRPADLHAAQLKRRLGEEPETER